MRSFFTLKISWKSSPVWLQLVFHFGTENREEPLKKSTLYIYICLWNKGMMNWLKPFSTNSSFVICPSPSTSTAFLQEPGLIYKPASKIHHHEKKRKAIINKRHTHATSCGKIMGGEYLVGDEQRCVEKIVKRKSLVCDAKKEPRRKRRKYLG